MKHLDAVLLARSARHVGPWPRVTVFGQAQDAVHANDQWDVQVVKAFVATFVLLLFLVQVVDVVVVFEEGMRVQFPFY